jgi:site-specific DNA recombinase
MTSTLKPRKRCAVYCRVSSDERLDQSFNSIDAQKEAGHAFIASQRAEGWIPVADDYDDGGFSGGHMERPALKRLMTDIEDGRIDTVVVYKIDRLTRSLADFSKMVEVFDRMGISFVSVTQQFNTTSSMGRLTLNVLLSFAQFEREVTGERIRDKISASKRKGMWMGGVPPLGYDVKEHCLVPNPREAALVKHIFVRFAELGSSTKLVKELKLDGATSKSWTALSGNVREGRPIDKSLIYKLLCNRTYLGELKHRGEWLKGVHKPLIDSDVWEAAQAVLRVSPRTRGNLARGEVPFLLKGLIVAEDGRAMTATWSRRPSGKLYRYYLHTRDNKEHAAASGLPRIPAPQIEARVLDQLRAFFRAPELMSQVTDALTAQGSSLDEATVQIALLQLDRIWNQLFPAEQQRIVRLLVKRVVFTPDQLSLQLWPHGLKKLSLEMQGAVAKLKDAA